MREMMEVGREGRMSGVSLMPRWRWRVVEAERKSRRGSGTELRLFGNLLPWRRKSDSRGGM